MRLFLILMRAVKSLCVLALISLITLKLLDLLVAQTLMNEAPQMLSVSKQRALRIKEFDPNQFARVTPSEDYIRRTDGLDAKTVEVTIDGQGFIANAQPPLPDAAANILFLGGSTTEALYVQPEQRFVSLVQDQLRAQFGTPINTYNAGVSGNHSMHSLLQLLAKAAPVKADVAVLMHNVNDLSLLIRSGNYWNNAGQRSLVMQQPQSHKNFKAALHTTLRGLKDMLVPNLYDFIIPQLEARYGFTLRYGDTAEEFAVHETRSEPYADALLLAQFHQSLQSFVQLCRAWQITPVLMTQFNRIHMDDAHVRSEIAESYPDYTPEHYMALYARFNEQIRELAQQENVLLIDLAAAIPQKKTYMYDAVHLTETGNAHAAEIITPALAALLKEE